MRVIDPLDGKTTYDSVRTVVKRYTALGDRPNLASPAVVMTIVGTGAVQKAVHGIKDADGKPAKPRAWMIQRWKACTEVDIQTVDDTNVTCEITNKGEVTIALFL